VQHAVHVLGQIGDHGEEAPIVADLSGDQCPDGRRSQHVPPGYRRWFGMYVFIHSLMQVFDFALGDEWVLIRVIIADQYPNDEPEQTNAAEHIEHRRPRSVMQDHTRQRIGQHGTELGPGEYHRSDYRSLLWRRPLRQHSVQCWKGGAFAQTHENSQHYQTDVFTPLHHHWCEQREYRG